MRRLAVERATHDFPMAGWRYWGDVDWLVEAYASTPAIAPRDLEALATALGAELRRLDATLGTAAWHDPCGFADDSRRRMVGTQLANLRGNWVGAWYPLAIVLLQHGVEVQPLAYDGRASYAPPPCAGAVAPPAGW